jgi:hypothetical protein
MKISNNMQVVICTIYPVQVTVFVFYYTPDVGIKLIRVILSDNVANTSILRPFRALYRLVILSPG